MVTMKFPAKKDIKAIANAHKRHGSEGRMKAIAISGDGKEKIFRDSGSTHASWAQFYAEYIRQYEEHLPWKNLIPKENRPFDACAEAHVWLELTGRGKNPYNYLIVAISQRGVIAAPCKNCAQWVGKAFGAVYTESTEYRPGKQSPKR